MLRPLASHAVMYGVLTSVSMGLTRQILANGRPPGLSLKLEIQKSTRHSNCGRFETLMAGR